MKGAITDVSYAASQTLNLKQIHSKSIVSRFILYFTKSCIMTSYAAADCHFQRNPDVFFSNLSHPFLDFFSNLNPRRFGRGGVL
jgi:hypothetical protein